MWSYLTFNNIKYNIRNVPLLSLPQSVKHVNSSLNWKENFEMLTVLVFYVDETINKISIVFSWFLLAFAICNHQR